MEQQQKSLEEFNIVRVQDPQSITVGWPAKLRVPLPPDFKRGSSPTEVRTYPPSP